MRLTKVVATLLFFLSTALWMTAPIQAGFSCERGSCPGSWGNHVYDTCWFDGMSSCINAHETCAQYCDTDGIHYETCDAGSGFCECGGGVQCPSCNIDSNYCFPLTFDYYSCSCISSPLIADLDGNDIALTGPEEGVSFDLNGDGLAEKVAWTKRGVRDGFLAMDRNNDGRISDGTELFGTAMNRSGFIGGLFLREDGADVPTKQVCPGVT